MTFDEQKKHLLKNPPKGVDTGSWVERTASYGNKTVTKGKKYRVKNYFRYLNHYGSKGERYPMWDEFIILKNDENWTVKMNLLGFKPCDAPLTKRELEDKILELEKVIMANTKRIVT